MGEQGDKGGWVDGKIRESTDGLRSREKDDAQQQQAMREAAEKAAKESGDD
jgi:hypothetical protein